MAKDIQVLIIEDDPYARDLMTLLLTRDWRTHVIGEIADLAARMGSTGPGFAATIQ